MTPAINGQHLVQVDKSLIVGLMQQVLTPPMTRDRVLARFCHGPGNGFNEATDCLNLVAAWASEVVLVGSPFGIGRFVGDQHRIGWQRRGRVPAPVGRARAVFGGHHAVGSIAVES